MGGKECLCFLHFASFNAHKLFVLDGYQKCSYYNDIAIENVKKFKYLGIISFRLGSFIIAKKHLCEQAEKAMHNVMRKIR
jgi:hypothetical protein